MNKFVLIALLSAVPCMGIAGEHAGRAAEHGGKAAEHGGSAAKEKSHDGHEHDEKAAEHGGEAAKEAQEHGGDKAKKKTKKKAKEHGGGAAEHGGQAAAEPGGAAPGSYYAEDIKAATLAYIKARSDADGVFHIHDSKTGEMLALKFEKIHNPVRQIDNGTYFACTDFSVVGAEKKLYDLDFWMNPATGELAIYDEKIHKEPRKSLLYGWYKQPRYTFVDDKVVSLY